MLPLTRLAPQLAVSDNSQPRIVYSISRSNGTIVPLIPADELPFNIRLQNVPRALTSDQLYGLHHVGSVPYTGLTFKLEHDLAMYRSNSQPETQHIRASSSGSKHFQPPDSLASHPLTHQPTYPPTRHLQNVPPRPISAHELTTNWRTSPTSNPSADHTQDIIDAIIGTQSGAEAAARVGYHSKSTVGPGPSGNEPDPDKKESCTYWIRTGECDYVQQGCLYKHEMPDSLEKLVKLGVRHWPRWWQERNQQVRFGGGGEVAGAGPRVKPSEWLKKGGESDSDEECPEEEKVKHGGAREKSAEKVRLNEDAQAGAASKPTTDIIMNVMEAPTKSCQLSSPNDLISFAALTPESASPASSTESSSSGVVCTPLSSNNGDHDSPSMYSQNTPSHEPPTPFGEPVETYTVQCKNRIQSVAAATVRNTVMRDRQLLDTPKQGVVRSDGLMALKHDTRTHGTTGANHTTHARGRKGLEKVTKPATHEHISVHGPMHDSLTGSGHSRGLRRRVPKTHNVLPIASGAKTTPPGSK